MSQSNKAIFIESVQFMYDHIDEAMILDDVAKACSVSLSTLKRVFHEVCGENPGTFWRRLRMEYAFRTLRSKRQGVLETALDVGFEDHSAFSRSFKEIFGYAPSDARKRLNIIAELESITLDEPDIVELENMVLQSVTCQGLYFECAPKAWETLSTHLIDEERADSFSGVFIGIGHDNPHDGEVLENQVRFTAGVGFASRDLRINKTTIQGGRYARFRYAGKVMNLGLAYHYIYGKWSQSVPNLIEHERPAFLMFEDFPKATGDVKVTIHAPLRNES